MNAVSDLNLLVLTVVTIPHLSAVLTKQIEMTRVVEVYHGPSAKSLAACLGQNAVSFIANSAICGRILRQAHILN